MKINPALGWHGTNVVHVSERRATAIEHIRLHGLDRVGWDLSRFDSNALAIVKRRKAQPTSKAYSDELEAITTGDYAKALSQGCLTLAQVLRSREDLTIADDILPAVEILREWSARLASEDVAA